MKKFTTYILLILITGTVSAQSKAVLKEQAKNQNKPYNYFEDPQVCSGCHWDKFQRHNVSQHSKAFTGDFFQKQFYDLVFRHNEGKFTYAQWFCVKEIENRLNPLEIRNEKYTFTVPANLKGEVFMQAKLNYRRMPDSFADYLEIDRRPVIQVAKELRKVKIN